MIKGRVKFLMSEVSSLMRLLEDPNDHKEMNSSTTKSKGSKKVK